MARAVMAGALFWLSIVLALLAAGGPAWAVGANEADTALKVPRFVSLHADRVNLRTGPGDRYPIEWVLTRREMPVEITAQFEHWRKIRDWEGTEGWVHERMVTGKRAVIVKGGGARLLYSKPDGSGGVVARAEPGVVAKLLECRVAWCRVEAADTTGWMRRADIWGVYPDEAYP